jgi:hypothetical protein
MSWTRVLKVMTRRQWRLRGMSAAEMQPLQQEFARWRGRESTLRNRLYELKKDSQLVADARTALQQNRPEALGIFDRVFGQVTERR